MTPVFQHGQLRLYLLSLLQDGPRHGYDIIKALGDQFAGTYAPSPGTIYPRLAKLVDEGLVSKRTDGRRTLYELTAAGRGELEGRHIELAEVMTEIASSVEERANAVRDEVAATLGSLRDNLTFQADFVRRAAAPSPATSDAKSSRVALKQAEVDLDMFRATTRADLRVAAARGQLTEQITTQLREQLAELSRWLREQLAER